MNVRLINLIKASRNGYNYPCVFIERAAEKAADTIDLPGGLLGRYRTDKAQTPTSTELDKYHQGLLSSSETGLRFLGAASVIFWGYFTSNCGRAKSRVEQYLDCVSRASEVVDAAIIDAAKASRTDLGAALSNLKPISQLGQLPFGSKVVAFLAPERAGIYDNRINSLLIAYPSLANVMLEGRSALSVDPKSKMMRDASVHVPRNQQRYRAWCAALTRLAARLNNASATWKCSESAEQSWRALDVERALFHLGTRERDEAVDLIVRELRRSPSE